MNNLEDLKKVKVEPSKEVWNKVEKTLRRRKILRRSAVAATVVAVVVPVVLLAADIAAPQIDKSTNQPIGNPQKETVVAQAAVSEKLTDKILDDSAIEATMQQSVNSTTQGVVNQSVASVLKSTDEAVAEVNVVEPNTTTSAVTPRQQEKAVPQKNVQTVDRYASATTKSKAENAQPLGDSEVASVREEKKSEIIGSKSPELPSESVLTIPNVVLPSDDNAENRVFSVHSDSPLTAYRLFIYNRGGRLVFQTTDINNSWDCTHNGEAVQQGTYVYVIQYSDCNGRPFVKKGTVTVLR